MASQKPGNYQCRNFPQKEVMDPSGFGIILKTRRPKKNKQKKQNIQRTGKDKTKTDGFTVQIIIVIDGML